MVVLGTRHVEPIVLALPETPPKQEQQAIYS